MAKPSFWQHTKSYFSRKSDLETKDSGLLMPGINFSGISNSQWIASLMSELGVYTGSRINYETEVGDLKMSSLLMAAVNWFARTLPEAPLMVQQPKEDRWENVLVHPMSELWKEPNVYFTGEQHSMVLALSWLLDGNCYFYKARDLTGQVKELWYLPHYLIEPQWNFNDRDMFITHYLYSVNGQEEHIPVEDLVHLRNGIDPSNPRKGLSPVAPILREVFTDNEGANFSAQIMKNLGIPGVIMAPASDIAQIDPDSRKEMRENFVREYSGDGRGKLLVTSRKIDVHQLSFNPKDMNTIDTRYISEERWSALTGIPAIVLGFGAGLRRSTFANFAEAREAAYESFLLPTMRIIAPQLKKQLLPEFDQDMTRRVAYDIANLAVLQEDRNKLSERIREEFKADLITREQALLETGRKPQPGDEVYYSQFRSQYITKLDASDDNEKDKDKKKKPMQKKDGLDDLETKAKKSDDEAAEDWWNMFAPEDAQGIETAEIESEES